MRARRAVLIGLVAASVVVGVRLYHQRRGAPPERGATVPALLADEDDALVLDATTERKPGERRVRLRVRGRAGEALLVMLDTGPSDPGDFAFGKANLIAAGDRAAGADFVAAVAAWLDVPPPARGTQGELAPFPLGYVRLGTEDGWEANKLFLQRGDHEAELFLNLSADGKQARLVQKDEAYAGDVLALLAMALRDGVPPRRTPQNDPLLASMQPLFASFQPVAGGVGKTRKIVALGDGFLVVRDVERDGKRGSELLRWQHPSAAPTPVATSDGVIADVLVSPDDKHAALAIVFPRSRGVISSDDPGMYAIVELATGSIDRLQSVASYVIGLAAAFSPDATRVAISSDKVTRVYDVASRRMLASTPAALDALPLQWTTTDGVLLLHADYDAGDDDDDGDGDRDDVSGSHDVSDVDVAEELEPKLTYYRWQPGKDAPRAIPAPAVRSPDGRHSIRVTKDGLTIAGPDGNKRVLASRPEDLVSYKVVGDFDRQRWLGPQHVIVDLEEPMTLDLKTAKLSYLFPTGGLDLEAASRDGRMILARDDQDRLLWARR
jgi:hypothetical protein